MTIEVETTSFGTLNEGSHVELFTLKNSRGLVVNITNYGGIVTAIHAPDSSDVSANVALGFPTLDGYINNHPYFGAIIGRYANRIAGGSFVLYGKRYKLFKNYGANTLHGGKHGFDQRVWKATPSKESNFAALTLTYTSKDLDEGFPGNLDCKIVYSLNLHNELRIDYEATTDKPTPVNLTNHSYFNLSGAGAGDILNHEVQIAADRYTPVDKSLIPTGELKPVDNTPYDFRVSTRIGARINDTSGGYDHNFVLNKQYGDLQIAAKVADPASGRILEVHTTEPGIQFYSGNFLDGTIRGNGGSYKKHYLHWKHSIFQIQSIKPISPVQFCALEKSIRKQPSTSSAC
ncbi:MAG: galactose mutarotase [Candidatus Obscuribacterales bacterium]|nr:galactose mutarotase [Candidatus Obscuribacterales bacterium]